MNLSELKRLLALTWPGHRSSGTGESRLTFMAFGFCFTFLSESDNFLDRLLGNSGALEVLIVSVSMGEQISMTGLFHSQMVTSRIS